MHLQRRLLILFSVALLALGLASCSSSSKSSDSGTPPAGGDVDAAITIESFKFTSDPVKIGATVTIANDDTTTHSVVSDQADLFGTEEDIEAGATATIVAPDEPGSYPFHCGIHNFMKGTLVVEE